MSRLKIAIILSCLITISVPQIYAEDYNLPSGIKSYGLPLPSHQNLILVQRFENYRDLRGLYTTAGKEVIPCEYLSLYGRDDFISATSVDEKYGVFDYDGKVILPTIYSKEINLENEDLRYLVIGGIQKNRHTVEGGKWGACDRHGKIVVPCEYEYCMSAGEGLYTVNRGGYWDSKEAVGGKWGLYGSGRELIPCEYDKPIIFKNDVATVRKDGQIVVLKNPLKDASKIKVSEMASTAAKKSKSDKAVSRYPAPNSDVDKDLRKSSKVHDNRFAVIISNENYEAAPVPYALNDGRIFREYCETSLGIRAENIKVFEDATYGNIIAAIEQTKNISEVFDGDGELFFYYAGHGVPDEDQATAFLLPIDGNPKDIKNTGISLSNLYDDLARLPLKNVVAFIDACFSGSKREDDMLVEGRAVAIKVKEEKTGGNLVVFTASTGDETAHQLEDKRHGLFTYFLLKAIQTNENPTLGTVSQYVTKQVKRHSVVINNKRQTPTVIPSKDKESCWMEIRL